MKRSSIESLKRNFEEMMKLYLKNARELRGLITKEEYREYVGVIREFYHFELEKLNALDRATGGEGNWKPSIKLPEEFF